MRSPAAVLAFLAHSARHSNNASHTQHAHNALHARSTARPSPDIPLAGEVGRDRASFEEAVLACCVPTHNTRAALEAAMAYAFALEQALTRRNGISPDDEYEIISGTARSDEILDAAIVGAARGAALAPEGFPGPSSGSRIAHLRAIAPSWRSPDEAMDFLYGVIGSGIESADVCAAVFGIFLHAGTDVMLALRMGASVGGDTDTIAALAGALCAAFAGIHNLPRSLVDTVLRANGLEVQDLLKAQAGKQGEF